MSTAWSRMTRGRTRFLLVAAIVRGEVYKQLFDFFVDARSPRIGAAHSSDPTENSHAETLCGSAFEFVDPTATSLRASSSV